MPSPRKLQPRVVFTGDAYSTHSHSIFLRCPDYSKHFYRRVKIVLRLDVKLQFFGDSKSLLQILRPFIGCTIHPTNTLLYTVTCRSVTAVRR